MKKKSIQELIKNENPNTVTVTVLDAVEEAANMIDHLHLTY